MTLEQQGAYIKLLAFAWASPNCALPGQEDILRQLVGWQDRHGDFVPVLNCFHPHPTEPTKLHNPRLYEEWLKVEAKSDKARASADLRWKQDRKRRNQTIPTHTTKPTTSNGTGAWESYCAAYTNTYGVAPTRNAKTNSLCVRFVQRVGVQDAAPIAAWYCSHRAQLYVQAGHCLELLLRDAEKLRTEWARGRTITTTRAKQIDHSSAMQQGVSEAKEILTRRLAEKATKDGHAR